MGGWAAPPVLTQSRRTFTDFISLKGTGDRNIWKIENYCCVGCAHAAKISKGDL